MHSIYIDPSRFNIYKLIHKYARREINRITELAGKMDLSYLECRRKFSVEFAELKHFLDDHAMREDTFIHPLLKECKSLLLAPIEKEHAQLDKKLYELTKALEQISNEPESYLFYLNFSKFQASYFYHLDKEETILLPELHKNFDDVRLNAVNQQLLQTMPFESVTTITKGMLLAITHAERVEIYAAMKKNMPLQPFKAMCQLAEEILTKSETQQLFSEIDAIEIFY
jgi:hemerythrin-like domain-containing protein